MPEPIAFARVRLRSALLALAVFVLLASVHTWPLVSNPAHWSRADNGDGLLNMWAIAWVGHQLPRDPLHLFNANIFYPEPMTLGYSEAMIVQGALAMPIMAAGGSAVLAYSLVLLAGFALTGWAFCLLVYRWTGSWGAAYISGSLAAFNSHVLVRLAHLQAQHVEFVALMLFAVDRLAASRRVRYAVWLGVAFALEGLTSIYLLVFSTWLLLFAVPVRAWEWLRRRPIEAGVKFAIAGVVGMILLGPYLFAYVQLHRATGFERSLEDNVDLAGSWVDYLATGSRIHFALWSEPFFFRAMSAAFPGVGAIVLVILGFTWPETRRDERFRMCAAAGAGCAAISILPRAPGFSLLYRVIPLFWAVRVEAHLSQIVLLMVAVVAGFGVAGLARRWRTASTWPAVAVVICALVNLEALRAPLELRFFDRIPPIYDRLAQERGAVIVEMPFHEPAAFFGNAMYMLNSTRHWRPMLNGYSGFRPGSYDETYEAIKGFPDDKSLLALHERGVTHVVVHTQEVNPDFREATARNPALTLVATGDDIELYRLK